jgi:hypothetical protein
MKKTVVVKPRRGRPATGVRPMIGFRADPELREAIEQWAEAQPDAPKLSDAIRRLVELGLTIKPRAKPSRKSTPSTRAKELAVSAIEKLIDPAAPPNERDERRQRLTKGPSEFREARVDLAKVRK